MTDETTSGTARNLADPGHDTATDEDQLLPQLVAPLREHRTKLRQDWAARIVHAGLLSAMPRQEMATETMSVYDDYVEEAERQLGWSVTRVGAP
jgi:rsbT co-antagonist protein RsbR